MVVVGVAIEEVAQLGGESARADQLSSLPVKAFPFQVMASQEPTQLLPEGWFVVLLFAAIGMVVELGQ